jgi:ABC-type siderophore export system fused ATPase/permease subunit
MVVGALLLCGLRESAYSRLQTRFVMLPWLVKLLLFAAVIQLVVEFHTNNVQPFIYYQF